MKLIGAGIWQCMTGWMGGGYDWKAWVYHYVPNYVHDKTLLVIYSVLSVTGVNARIRAEHMQKNEKAWERYRNENSNDIYLEQQQKMQDFFYGKHDASYNGCEVIAVYNALCALNDGRAPVSFPLLLNEFERSGIAAKGAFGTSPLSVYSYFHKLGHDSKMLFAGKITAQKLRNMQDQYDTYILTAYNDANDLGGMIHTVSITAQNGTYVIHNAGDPSAYHSLEEAVNGFRGGAGKTICLIGVKKANEVVTELC